MKKFFAAFCIFALSAGMAYAQKVVDGSFDILKSQYKVGFNMDFTEGVIKGMVYTDYIEYEPNWEKGYKEIVSKFIEKINDELDDRNIVIGTFSNVDYTLVYKVATASRKGDLVGQLILLDKENNVKARAVSLKGKGGHVGTHLNLMGDGARSAGKTAGRFIKKQL